MLDDGHRPYPTTNPRNRDHDRRHRRGAENPPAKRCNDRRRGDDHDREGDTHGESDDPDTQSLHYPRPRRHRHIGGYPPASYDEQIAAEERHSQREHRRAVLAQPFLARRDQHPHDHSPDDDRHSPQEQFCEHSLPLLRIQVLPANPSSPRTVLARMPDLLGLMRTKLRRSARSDDLPRQSHNPRDEKDRKNSHPLTWIVNGDHDRPRGDDRQSDHADEHDRRDREPRSRIKHVMSSAEVRSGGKRDQKRCDDSGHADEVTEERVKQVCDPPQLHPVIRPVGAREHTGQHEGNQGARERQEWACDEKQCGLTTLQTRARVIALARRALILGALCVHAHIMANRPGVRCVSPAVCGRHARGATPRHVRVAAAQENSLIGGLFCAKAPPLEEKSSASGRPAARRPRPGSPQRRRASHPRPRRRRHLPHR